MDGMTKYNTRQLGVTFTNIYIYFHDNDMILIFLNQLKLLASGKKVINNPKMFYTIGLDKNFT